MRLETTIGFIVMIALIFSLGMFVLGNIQDTQSVNSTEYNVTGQGVNSLSAFSSFLTPMIFLFVAIAIIAIVAQFGKSGRHSGFI